MNSVFYFAITLLLQLTNNFKTYICSKPMDNNVLVAQAMYGPGDKNPDSNNPGDSGTPAGGGKPVAMNNNIRQAWNDYVDWLDKKGLKGHPSLDHNDLSFKMLDEYRKENPNTPLSRDMIVPIQQEFTNYRNYALNQIQQNHAELGPGVTPDNFMRDLTKVDGIAGQRTTSYKFPKGYMKDMASGQTQDKGFIPPGTDLAAKLSN